MGDWNRDGDVVPRALATVRTWLESDPDLRALLANLPALEPLLAVDVNNQNPEFLTVAASALDRLNRGVNIPALSNGTLAALIGLDLRMLDATQDTRFRDGAAGAIDTAKARYDAKLGFFKIDASGSGNEFYTGPNALLGEAFYLAWRKLEDQTLRPIAGEVLGQVSDMFDAGAGLYRRKVMPDGAPQEADSLGGYAAAIHLFVTAASTTGRGTYHSRAAIVANYALANFQPSNASTAESISFAAALLGLGHVADAANYRARAQDILRHVSPSVHTDPGIAAQFMLAARRAQLEEF